jgi:flagellar motor switch protein FliG
VSAQYVAELTRPQKAAALMMAVGPQQAADLLAFLSETEVEALAKEIAALREIPMDALQQVVNELQSQASSRNAMLEGGLDYARELLARWQGPGGEVAARIAHGAVDAPFRFLADVEPAELVQAIAEEHPQTLALVLAHLPAGYAARVLEGLDPQLRADAALRVATMEWVAPEVIRRTEQVIHQRLGTASPDRQDHRGGAKELAGILNKMGKNNEGDVLRDLSELHPELAAEVRALMFVFDDITMFRDLQEVMRTIEPKDLALAIKGAADEVRAAVTRNISDRARESLQEESEVLGAVRLTDVEAARARIIAQIRELEDAGKIVVRSDAGGGLVE